VLLQDEPLLQLLDAWLCNLGGTDFTDSLPLLGRSMSSFDTIARRRLFEKIQRGQQQSMSVASHAGADSNPAFEAALPLLYKILWSWRASMSTQKERWRRWQLALGVDDEQNDFQFCIVVYDVGSAMPNHFCRVCENCAHCFPYLLNRAISSSDTTNEQASQYRCPRVRYQSRQTSHTC